MSWTNERVAELKRLWTEEGLSGKQCADRLGGTTRAACLAKLDRLGLLTKTQGIVTSTGQTSAKSWRRTKPPKPVRTEAQRRDPEPLPATDIFDVPPERRVKLVDLEIHHCRWPLGEVGHPDFGFCGARKHAASAYCENHFKASLMPQPLGRSPVVERGGNRRVA